MTQSISQTTQAPFLRKDKLLYGKFKEYLLPTTCSALALSLNEFADGFVVSNLLGTNALAAVNLGMPVMILYAMIFILLGNGGSILYSIACGKHQKEEANQVFTIALSTLACISILISAGGWFFSHNIAYFLSEEASIRPLLTEYIPVLFLSAPFIICTSGLAPFLVCDGNPKLAMLVHIVANVINIALDIILIKYFHMGIQGAAYATLIGYTFASLLILGAGLRRKLGLKIVLPSDILAKLGAITGRGLASSFNQFGLAIKIVIINFLVSFYAGINGLVAFSLCIQCLSIVSIFLAGIVETFSPILGLLCGEKDISGIRLILKRVLLYVLIITLVLTGLLFFFPRVLASAYGVISPEQMTFCIIAIRIFVLSFLFRNVALIGMVYAQVVGMKKLAFAVTLLDGLGVIPLAYILGIAFGAQGVFAAFPVSAGLTLIFLWYAVRYLARVQHKSHWAFFVLEKESQALYQASIQNTAGHVVHVSADIMQFAEQQGLPNNLALRLGLALEEMCMYTLENAAKSKKDIWIDIVVRIYPEHVLMSFKSNGPNFSPLDWQTDTSDNLSSLALLKQLAQSIDYSVTLGLNSTLLQIGRERSLACNLSS